MVVTTVVASDHLIVLGTLQSHDSSCLAVLCHAGLKMQMVGFAGQRSKKPYQSWNAADMHPVESQCKGGTDPAMISHFQHHHTHITLWLLVIRGSLEELRYCQKSRARKSIQHVNASLRLYCLAYFQNNNTYNNTFYLQLSKMLYIKPNTEETT